MPDAIVHPQPPHRSPSKSRVVWLVAAVVVAGLAAFLWFERQPILAWHFARGLASAKSEQCAWYVDRLAPLGEEAIGPLLRHLQAGDETAKTNCGWALSELAARWSTDANLGPVLSSSLCNAMPACDDMARRHMLQAVTAMMASIKGDSAPDWLTRDLCRVLPQLPTLAGEESRPAAIELAAQFVHRAGPTSPDVLQACAALIDVSLKDPRTACRVSAIRLATAPGIDMQDRVAPLLIANRETAAEVRVMALLALGAQEDVLATDDLLSFLHDSDERVRAVAEQTLKSRGLVSAQIHLARQMTDPKAQVRARVPALVLDFPDLDTRLWLERLSRDGSPSVRAAVLRAVGETKEWRLADRMREMAQGDPSPTVRQIARYYLQEQLGESR